MLTKAAKVEDIAEGGLKGVEINGHEVTLCNYEGKIYAVERRCGHMNAPLDMGTLNGKILICPMHFAQFDITTGERLSGPVPGAPIKGLPQNAVSHFTFLGKLMAHIKTHDLKTYKVVVDGNDIKVDV